MITAYDDVDRRWNNRAIPLVGGDYDGTLRRQIAEGTHKRQLRTWTIEAIPENRPMSDR